MSTSLIIQAFFGFFFLILVALIFSENKKQINWKLIITAFLLQNVIFLLIRYVPLVHDMLEHISMGLIKLLEYAKEGASFVFGNLTNTKSYGFIFALVVVPTIVFFSSLISILYFYGIIQKIISILAHLLRKTMKLSGVESLVIIADVFLGQSEGPLVIGPYIKLMTKSQLACAFLAGMANLSGSTLGIYLAFLAGDDPVQQLVFANYLLTATFMNAFAAIIFAKILFPETEDVDYSKPINLHHENQGNVLDSIVGGAMTGIKVGVAITTILLAVIPLIHLIDAILGQIGALVHVNQIIASSTNNTFDSLSLEYVLGQIFRIFAFFMGVTWSETLQVGSLLGQKVAINEFVAYIGLGKLKAASAISANSIYISTFALASFSNFSSIGISMGVYSILAPEKQKVIASFAFKALFGAVLAGFMTATIAGFWHNIFG